MVASNQQKEAEQHEIPPYSLIGRQWIGLNLAAVGSLFTVLAYAAEESLGLPPLLTLFVGLALAGVGLVLHETRPYRRPTYDDAARDIDDEIRERAMARDRMNEEKRRGKKRD